MSRHATGAERRLHELLADRATQALSAAEEREAAALLAACPSFDGSQYDRAAAAVALALEPGAAEPVPAPLRRRLGGDAIAWLVQARG